ncbi:unnamed protein product [marine sediment metagenome]|uniref:Uncharacterized protein n=1 Tax=marine sediment metagenome TaxID=412755 RepID=X1B2A5_9ZZZZ
MLMDEYANYKTMINGKLLEGADPSSKEIQASLKLLLDISKEINRLTQVSADKKFEAFTKDLSPDGDMVIEVGNENGK